MTCWLITRHPGALHWARRQGLTVDRHEDHLDIAEVGSGDIVIGTLPVNLAAAVNERGARYVHLSLEVPPELRGQELTADQLDAIGARLEEYVVTRAETRADLGARQ